MIKCIDVLTELNFEHLAGSKEEKIARDIIKKHLDQSNIKYEEQEFTLHGFDHGSAQIDVDGQSFDANPYGLVETCQISGQLCVLDNAKVIEHNIGAFKDKIIMCKGSSRNAFDIMLKTGVKGFISVGAPGKLEANSSHRQKNVESGILPSVTISYDNAVKLLKYNGQEINISINQERSERKAYNIVATLGENKFDDNITYLTAHYDTVAQSHGSSDNGAGTVVILKAAQYFAENNPARTLKVIFCSGEEMGLLGSSAYVQSNLEEVKSNGAFVVNVDVAGDYFGSDAMMVIGTSDTKGYLAGISMEKGFLFNSSINIYSSDAMPFAVYEVPSVNLARFGGNASSVIHTADDRIENISSDNLDFYYNATINILDRVLNSKVWPIQKEIDPKLRPKIEKYMWGSRREAPKLEWKAGFKK